MGKNLLTGKSMINISMPVIIFSDSSVLGRMAECFVFTPNYFEKVDFSLNNENRQELLMTLSNNSNKS